MRFRSQENLCLNNRSVASLYLIGVVAVIALLLTGGLAFEVTYFDHPKVSLSDNSDTNYSTETSDSRPIQHKSRAPEAGTAIMFLGGIGGMIVRFVRKSFDKFKRMFDLFYSTRKGGTGLGLAVVQRIAKAHDAELEVVSSPDRGTRIRVVLAAADSREPSVLSATTPAEPASAPGEG